MRAHRIETIVQPGGALAVQGLPVPEGTRVELIVLVNDEMAHEEPAPSGRSLRGTPYRFDAPFEPAVPAAEWEATR
ncbi:hypothetical protein [Sorangium cellulosum]|jgi:hypothetical protein|uniref:hypothetical protein n=1 Tax=Sorangium cellulosum TaxID=56 RepID=UPI0010108148|nr:hypothetical protein [Sorangium cellulosum]